MENWDKRVSATMFIWLGIGIAIGISGLGDESTFSDEVITGLLAGAAFLTTVAVWFLGRDTSSALANVARSAQETHKPKNTAEQPDQRTRLLLELMDEDEKRALKNRLIAEMEADGEDVSLSDLLQERPRQQRR